MPMKKKTFIAVIIILVLAISFLLVGLYWANLGNHQIDTSWVAKAKELAKNYSPITTNFTTPDVAISYCNMYLVRNGSEQLIYYGNGDTLSKYLGDLLNGPTIDKGTVSQDYLDKVLAKDEVVILGYRKSIFAPSHPTAKYYMGYFILEDNLNQGPFGTIIGREISTSNLHLLAIHR